MVTFAINHLVGAITSPLASLSVGMPIQRLTMTLATHQFNRGNCILLRPGHGRESSYAFVGLRPSWYTIHHMFIS